MSEVIEICCINSYGKIEKEFERRCFFIRFINERVVKFREESVNIEVRIFFERVRLIIEFYKSDLVKGKLILV